MNSLPLFSFPDFNIYSTPLLILVSQGLIFTFLLLGKYFKKRNPSHLILALIVLLVCYHQICYTVGFMGWYNVYKTTKINYWLIPISLALAPMIFLYVKSVTASKFEFSFSRSSVIKTVQGEVHNPFHSTRGYTTKEHSGNKTENMQSIPYRKFRTQGNICLRLYNNNYRLIYND